MSDTPAKHPSRLARDSLVVGAATILSRLLGFARDVLIARLLGTGPVADAFLAALRLPNLVRRVLGEGGLNAPFVPLYLSVKAQDGEAAARRFASEAASHLGLLLLLFVALAELFAPWVVLGLARFSVLVNDGHGGVAEAVISLDVVPGIVVGTDLVANGSFEDVSASTGNNGPSDWGYRNPNGIIAGWTDVNGNRIEQHWDSPNGVAAPDGRIWLDMDGYNTNTHIVQQVVRIEEGATYLLSFSLGDADTAVSDDGIRVVWNGQLVYEGVPTNPWQTLSFRCGCACP